MEWKAADDPVTRHHATNPGHDYYLPANLANLAVPPGPEDLKISGERSVSAAEEVGRLEKAIGKLAVSLAYLALFIPAFMLRAWVISLLWYWYVVPVFGLAPLRLVFAYGLSLTVSAFRGHDRVVDERPDWEQRMYLFAPSLALLALGWIGTWFI